ncbi:hypothetical protein QQ045_025106 [Rhodiola kirilowii]
MGIWDFELGKKVEELMAEASVWSDWKEKVAEMIGVKAAAATGEGKLSKVANVVNETSVYDGDLVGRVDVNLRVNGSKGRPFSFRNAATDPKMSQVPFQAREESGIRCSPSVDKNEKISRGLSTRKSKKAYMSSFSPPSSDIK